MVSAAASERPKWRTLAGRDQVLHRAGDVLDGDVRIDAVLVEQIDVVRARRRSIASVTRLMCSGLAVEPAAFARRRIKVKAELGGDQGPRCGRAPGLPDQGFVGPGTVDLGSIKQGDPEVVGAANDADALGLFRRLAVGSKRSLGFQGRVLTPPGRPTFSCAYCNSYRTRRTRAVSGAGRWCEDGAAGCQLIRVAIIHDAISQDYKC